MEHRLIKGGEIYLPFARSRVKALQAAGLAYASQKYEVNGCTIRVRITPGHEYIELDGGGYMESGLQDMRHVLAGFEQTYRPSVVRFSPRVASLSKPIGKLPNSQGRKITDGDVSLSSAGKTGDLSDTVTVYLGTSGEPTTFTTEDAVYSQEPEIIRMHKLMRMQIPPSVFTGKLKLYVQALYGSKRRDYEVGSTGNGGTSNQIALDTGKTRTDEGGTVHKIYAHLLYQYPTSGLAKFEFTRPGATTPSTKYVLITIHSDKVTWRTMRSKSAATPPVKSFSAESEAMLLATLVPDSVENTAAGTMTATGSPLAYGWHFDQTGRNASICMKEGKLISGQQLYDMADSTIPGLTFTQYTMAFTLTPGETNAGDVLGYSTVVAASGDHIPYVQSNIFTPATDGSGMQLLLPGDPTPWNCHADLGPTPIYCFYSDNDLKTVFAKNSGITSRDDALQPPPEDGAAIQQSSTIIPNGSWSYSSTILGLDVGVCGFYIDGQNFTDAGLTTGLFESKYEYIFAMGDVVTGTYYPEGVPVNYTYAYFSPTGTTLKNRETYNGQKSSRAVTVIPYGNASSVLLGSQKSFSTGEFSERISSHGSNTICYDSRGTLNWSGQLLSWFEQSYTPPTDPEYTTSSLMVLVTDKASATLSNYSFTSTDEVPPADRPYKWAFEAQAFVNPLFQYPVTVKTSEFGMTFHQYAMPDGGISYGGGWTDGALYAVPVGWA